MDWFNNAIQVNSGSMMIKALRDTKLKYSLDGINYTYLPDDKQIERFGLVKVINIPEGMYFKHDGNPVKVLY